MKTASWRCAWEESSLPPRHRRVLSGLAHSMGANGGQHATCYPSAALLGKRSGYGERVVRQTLRELDGGWLTLVARPGRATCYYARLPDLGWKLPEEPWQTGGRQASGDRAYPEHWQNPGTTTPGSTKGTPASARLEPRRRDADEIREIDNSSSPDGSSSPAVDTCSMCRKRKRMVAGSDLCRACHTEWYGEGTLHVNEGRE